MLRPPALLKGYRHLLMLDEIFCLRRNHGSTHKRTGFLQDWLGGFQRGTGVPLCVVAGVGYIGEGPHRKGPLPYAVFWLLFVRTKSNPGYGAGGPESHRITQYLFGEKCFSPTRPAIRESALHRPDAPAPTHPGKENQNSAVPTVRGWGSTSRMLLTPVRYMTIRSKPRPKPAWRQEP